MKFIYSGLVVLGTLLLIQCNDDKKGAGSPETTNAEPAKPRITWKTAAKNTYHFESSRNWVDKSRKAKDTAGIDIVLAVNRTDSSNLAALDSILVPDDLSGDLATYMHFPQTVSSLHDVSKIVFFSYPTQTFAAYENGNLVQAGPTNMGRKKDPTPTGLFFSNWKAEQTTSTFNDEWDLKWNFNIENKEGIGWHQYALPGYPASHSCLRLQTNDAKKLYEWADQWKLEGADKILANGTPAIVFGSYPFGGPKPWLQLVTNPNALTISEASLDAVIKPNLQKILEEQKKTAELKTSAASR